jgi:hypothetical protein
VLWAAAEFDASSCQPVRSAGVENEDNQKTYKAVFPGICADRYHPNGKGGTPFGRGNYGNN